MPSTDCSLCMHQWRRWIRPLSILFYVVAICIALPLIVIEFQVWNTQIHLRAWFIGGFFVLLAIPISIWGIIQHLIHYTQPHLQRHIIRIIWMVPIYAINAWFALRFKDVAIYLDTARECYEAYVIYNFMAYLLNYLHSEYPDLAGTLSDKPQQKHLIPLCWCPVWPMGNDLITNCKHGVLQYTVVRPVTTIIAFICNLAGAKVYMEGTFSFKSAWTYLVVINNISQIWAMYCLVLFYQATKEELAPIKPIWKFMCVKAVVFLSFWQSVLIAILVQVGVIKANNLIEYDTDDLATGLQDFCICIEMFLASLAHYFSFSHKPYVDYAMGYVNCCDSFAHMWDVSDVRNDVVDHVRHVGKTAQKIVTRRGLRNEVQPTNTERTPLLGSNSESTDEGGLLSSTPPVIIHRDEAFDSEPEEQALEQNFYDEAPNFADNGSINTLEGSTASDFLKKSTTSSMNNFAQFSESIDTGHVQNAEDVNSDSLLVNIDHDSQPVDTHPVSGTSTDSGTVGNNV